MRGVKQGHEIQNSEIDRTRREQLYKTSWNLRQIILEAPGWKWFEPVSFSKTEQQEILTSPGYFSTAAELEILNPRACSLTCTAASSQTVFQQHNSDRIFHGRSFAPVDVTQHRRNVWGFKHQNLPII